jgi:hypothetical protein
MNYKEAYLYLFNKTTDIIEQLKASQREAESIATEDKSTKNKKTAIRLLKRTINLKVNHILLFL